ncbi:S9 family peptidase [Roseivirga misakiensis]|uniref:Aminoacyl peptidase n=1 Tax=Roseivirga misakiensis TaxID=1563681 RepID=A0A1E5T6H3_9BACT|nr:prolyl oligopeptidase family serine peptidase [Roseivirga misakiensis]OEK06963.1 aminoacyl peptidase [Roseivirga misakiensis]
MKLKQNIYRICSICVMVAWLYAAPAQAQEGYQRPPEAIAKLIDAPSTPSVSIDSKAEWMLLMERPGYPSIAEVAATELRIGGTRINPATNGRSRRTFMTGLTLKEIATGKEYSFSGLPAKPQISNVSWSSDESKIAFTHTTDNGIELWLADVESKSAKKLTGAIINNAYVSAFDWMPDGNQLLVSTIMEGRGEAPKKPRAPKGPVTQETAGAEAPSRTYQDLLENPYDASLFEYYTTVQLKMIDLDGNQTKVGSPNIIKAFSISPDGQYILTQTIQKPFSYLVPASRFPFNYEVWDTKGNMVKEMAKIALDEVRPKGFDATRLGARSMTWRADKPATLYWAEAKDGGDPKADIAERDVVYMVNAPFTAKPTKLAGTSLRYAGIQWGDDSRAILNESWWAKRLDKRTLINPSKPGTAGKVIIDRSTTDRYNDPGRPMMVSNDYGWSVLKFDKDNIFMSSTGGSAEGDRPFLSKFNLKNQKQNIIFRSEAPYYERPVDIISAKADKIITIRESENEPPNYFVRNLKKGSMEAITDFPHPQPDMMAVNKEIIKYKREDGVDLTAVLYTPKGYDKEKDGPLPVLMWAYPIEYKSVTTAAQVRGTPYSFTRVSSGSPLFWVLRGYAVMANTQFPIIGEGDNQPNDKFREQLVMNAKAAIDAVADLGVGDRNRVGVGGHSYGAFMTANLLAHSDLFAAGIARSGAYNRTLTPFGFQREERTYWEAPELYNYMSPFMHADKVNEPLLLIHGEADNNSGTFPIQSIRYYNAIKGHGGTSRLVMLPDESHGYRAKESILHMLWEMDTWLEKYVKNAATKPEPTSLDSKGR